MHLQGDSAQAISAMINRSRQWVYKWIARYEQDPHGNWYLSESNAPKNASRRMDKSLENSIISIRKNLQKQPYSQTGAINIMYELQRLGLPVPSLATINRVLSRNSLVGQSSVKTRKNTEYPTFFSNVQQMDLIGPKYLKGGFRFYLFDIIDVETHFAGVYPTIEQIGRKHYPLRDRFLAQFSSARFSANGQ